MPTAVTTSVTELPESRVSVEVEVAPEEIQKSLESQARKLGREMKVPGFRTGKIPPAVVIQRIGREPILDEAIRGRLTDWYLKAVEVAGIAPVGDPSVDLGDTPAEGKPLQFSFEVGVRPAAKVSKIRGIEVGRREAAADPEAIDRQIDEMRERLARLEVVKRPAENGDFLTIDFVGTVDGEPFSGGEGRDQLIELGAGHLIPGFEDGLVGASAGETRTVDAVFPDDYGAKHVAGKPAQFEITVKEVKHKDLPALDDDFADAAGYDTLDELRASIAEELVEHDKGRVEAEFRAAALDAVVAEAEVDIPDALVEARARELLDRLLHSLEHQGISKSTYLQISGKSEQDLIDESKPDAEQALRREAVLAAVMREEAIEPSEDDLLNALESAAEREQVSRQKLLAKLRQAGRVDMLAKEVAAEQAIDLIVREAKPIPIEEAQRKRAEEAKKAELWTPGKADKPKRKGKDKAAKGEDAGKLWTPGS